MRVRSRKAEAPPFLSGWKEIANYMGKGVRTVQRYERELGLPVRRPAGKPWGSVIATRAEIDGWVQASPIRDTYSLSTNELRAGNSQATKGITAGLAEMNRLREQLLDLRLEVTKSVQLVHKSVVDLQGEMTRNHLLVEKWAGHNPSSLYSMDEGDSLDRSERDFSSLATNHPKAS